MRHYLPRSLIFFLVTAAIFGLQAFPFTGIFLMFMAAPLWSILLVNAGMLGVALEAVTGRVARLWFVLPLGFYGGYCAMAVHDRQKLRELTTSYDATNARVVTGFDPIREALVEHDSGGNPPDGPWLTQNYDLPVAYAESPKYPEGYRSSRMMEAAVCAKVRVNPAIQAASIVAVLFDDGGAFGNRPIDYRFCELSMPERPNLPLVQLSRQETKASESGLPVTRITTTITMPDQQRYELLAGFAAPLRWFPMPVIGCSLNDAGPRWVCDAGFWRNGFTPIVSGISRYSPDRIRLARALGLTPVSIEERRGADPTLVLAKVAAVEEATLTHSATRHY